MDKLKRTNLFFARFMIRSTKMHTCILWMPYCTIEFFFTIEKICLLTTPYLRLHWGRLLTQGRDWATYIHLQVPFLMDNDTSQTSVKSTVTYVPNPWFIPISHHWLPLTFFQLTTVFSHEINNFTRLLERWRKRGKKKKYLIWSIFLLTLVT